MASREGVIRDTVEAEGVTVSPRRSLRGALLRLTLTTLTFVAVLTLAATTWMHLRSSRANLDWTRREIRRGLEAKGTLLVQNHALALRRFVADNAFEDTRSFVTGAVLEDDDVEYGLFLGGDQVAWVFVAPRAFPAPEGPPEKAWKSLNIDPTSLASRTRQVRALSFFGHEVYEFSAPVIAEASGGGPGELLGTIRYGLSTKRTDAALRDAQQRWTRDLWRTVGLLGVIMFATMCVGVVMVARQARRITGPLQRLTEAAQRVAAGDHSIRAEVGSEDELDVLGRTFNQMVSDLEESYGRLRALNETLESQVEQRTKQLSRALEELWSEMDLAQKIQTLLLPRTVQLLDLEVAADMTPAEAVGGDYYDYFTVNDESWVLVGDVSGHGVTAGLSMMMVQTAVRAVVLGGDAGGGDLQPSAVLGRVNSAVHANLDRISPWEYMTLVALKFKKNVVTYSGLHLEILVYRTATARVERFCTQGAWVGMVEDIGEELRDEQFSVSPGDMILLYTDGLIETVIGPERRRLGSEGLAAHFGEVAQRGGSVKDVLEELLSCLAGTHPEDDVSAVVLRYAPKENGSSFEGS